MIKNFWRTSLAVPWLGIRLPTWETKVWSLVWEDSTCRGATKPRSHNYQGLSALEFMLWDKNVTLRTALVSKCPLWYAPWVIRRRQQQQNPKPAVPGSIWPNRPVSGSEHKAQTKEVDKTGMLDAWTNGQLQDTWPTARRPGGWHDLSEGQLGKICQNIQCLRPLTQ